MKLSEAIFQLQTILDIQKNDPELGLYIIQSDENKNPIVCEYWKFCAPSITMEDDKLKLVLLVD